MALPRLFDGLTFRVGILLTVALFPIGLIAITLTHQVESEQSARAERSLLALTAEAAASEESYVRAGITVARTLAAAVAVIRDQPLRCSAMMRGFLAQNPQYSFAGLTGPNGIIACASEAVGSDYSTFPAFTRMRDNPVPTIEVSPRGGISGVSVIVLMQPVFDGDGNFDGMVSVSMPNERIFRNVERLTSERPIELILFNEKGEILTAESGFDEVWKQLPQDHDLTSFAGMTRQAFTAKNAAGIERVFAVVPIVSDKVYALGSWPVTRIEPDLTALFLTPLMFASLMWAVSLGVAYLAVHRLALRNIADLRSRMREFISGRRFVRSDASARKPLEFREIDQTWEELAATVVREEAELENTIHSRTVLLKEVHHRVKNNLQLIASIVSMKVRKAKTPDAKAALKEVQMRVMSIATVHRALYTTSTIGRVQADELLRSIVDKTIEAGLHPTGAIRIDTSYDPVSLYPDQAVPLSLLTSEALTNALKYIGRSKDGAAPWIRVQLRRNPDETAVIEVENSIGDAILPETEVRGTGLGANLIQAFAQQMRGSLQVEEGAGRYLVRVKFPINAFDDAEVNSAIAEED
jgi:two-component sensor histidine kinase